MWRFQMFLMLIGQKRPGCPEVIRAARAARWDRFWVWMFDLHIYHLIYLQDLFGLKVLPF